MLFVSGFVADTYSEIERSFVELCASPDRDIDYLWLVPEISFKHNRFARPENRAKLAEPIWVTHLRREGVPYVVRNISKYNVFANFFVFRNVFRNYRIDAIYTHFGFERFWAAFFGKLCGKVIIWNEHWHSLGRRYGIIKRAFYRWFVDDFVSVSRFITSTLPKTARVHTVPNAIMPNLYPRPDRAKSAERRRRLSIAEEAKVVLMVAAFRREKRHMLALEICKRVLQAREGVVFVFLGEGPLRQPFLDRVRFLGLGDSIIAPGYVDNVDDYYAIADVSILTSHFEPFGYVVLEAMRHGIPVVAFATGGPAEVIRDGETGVTISDGDVGRFTQRLLEVLNNARLRQVMGRNAHHVVQRDYNREHWINRLNAIVANAVAR